MQTEPTTTMDDTSPAAPFAGNGIAVDRRQRTRSSTPRPSPRSTTPSSPRPRWAGHDEANYPFPSAIRNYIELRSWKCFGASKGGGKELVEDRKYLLRRINNIRGKGGRNNNGNRKEEKGWEEFRGEWKVFILINFLSRRWVNFG